jgi:hypothetical protein
MICWVYSLSSSLCIPAGGDSFFVWLKWLKGKKNTLVSRMIIIEQNFFLLFQVLGIYPKM